MRDYTPSEMIEHLHLENEELREALAEARRVWTIEEAIEGEGTYTLAICASREVAEAIVAGLGLRRPAVGIEEVEPVTDAASWLKEQL